MFKKVISPALLALMFVYVTLVTANAAPPPQTDGEAYIVQSGDWLSKIADKYYGDPLAYAAIVTATNDKAAADNSFTAITDPNVIEVGQKLWIPAASASAAPTAPTIPSDDASLQQAYLNAVNDAATVEPAEISKDLIAVVESNEALVWQGEAGHRQVLALTWTAWDGYDAQVGQDMTMTRQTWVTIVPQLKDFCTAYNSDSDALTLRLEQLLGLPPHNGKTRFVEMWVSPADLFRPSPDPEITDYEAELAFPTSKYNVVSPDYMTWFNNLSQESYGENGYPWTRLGYTYDWGNPASEVGLSEFVIDTGAQVAIEDVTPTEDYCR